MDSFTKKRGAAMYQYRTKGTCSRMIRFDIQDGMLRRVEFEGGCSGNTQGLSALLEGPLFSAPDTPSGTHLEEISRQEAGNTSTPQEGGMIEVQTAGPEEEGVRQTGM
jgi:uncharacterized protein (TIGR03905 family)